MLLSRLESEPGVESAAVAMGLPFTSDRNALTGFRFEGQPVPESASMPTASMRIVSPGYFDVMKIPIRVGRSFDRRDTATSPEVVLINERAAQRYFAGQDPVGQQLRVSAELARAARNGPKTIVGVVGDVKYRGLDEDTPAEIYLPYRTASGRHFHRCGAPRRAIETKPSIPVLRRDVAALDSSLPLANVDSLATLVDASLAGRRFTMLVLLAFAAIAVVLADRRCLRCARLSGRSAEERNRSSVGDRRVALRGDVVVRARRRGIDSCRPGRGPRQRPCGRPVGLVVAVQCHTGQSATLAIVDRRAGERGGVWRPTCRRDELHGVNPSDALRAE